MQIRDDHFFQIGTGHQKIGLPCQDYAVSGCVHYANLHFAIVSDGCSASRNSDIGARITAMWFRHIMEMFPYSFFPKHYKDFKESQKIELVRCYKDFVRRVQLWMVPNPEALDATLVVALWAPWLEQGYILVAGDGNVCYRYRNGNMQLLTVDWGNGMPPYLSYSLDNDRRVDLGRATQNVTNKGVYTTIYTHLDGKASTKKLLDLPLHVESVNQCGMAFQFFPQHLTSVSVFTDGLESFSRGTNCGPVMADLFTNIKVPNGEFVKRTCLANLKRLKKDGLESDDDFSMASLYFEHDTE